MFFGWCVFLGALGAAVLAVSAPSRQAQGPVTAVCIQTQDDADATLLVQDGAAVLIDTGEDVDAPHILEVLAQYGVTKLDYLILSHPDADHIGGAVQVLSQIPADRVVQPYYTEEDERLTALDAWLEEQGVSVLYPTHTQTLRAGGMRLLVYPPLEKHYRETNNYSLAVLVQHGKVNMMFPGDALRKRSEELLHTDWPAIDLYKVAHHGRANAATEALFEALRPNYAVVTATSADQAVLDAADRQGAQLYYTAQGDCMFVSDGSTLTPQ